ncbi:MAG: PfkB family carbohydrate kinase [bacterium]|nr:PfkB family carbohydrate kinase [bacterium]
MRVIPARADTRSPTSGGPQHCALGFLGDLLEDVVVYRRSAVRADTDTPCVIRRRRGGSAANAAVAAAGVAGPGRVRFLGQVGADSLGDRLLDELAAQGVEPCVRRRGRTGAVVVLLGGDGERTMLTDRGACAEFDGFEPGWLDGLAVLHTAGYSLLEEPSRSAALGMIGAVRRAGGTVSVDACSVGAIADSGVAAFRETLTEVAPDVLLCDAGEAALLDATGGYRQFAHLVVVKDGPRPTRLYGASFDGEPVTPPRLEDVPDTTGAGDAFAGGLLAARLAGNAWREATVAGQVVAAAHLRAIAVQDDTAQVGAGPDSSREVPEETAE